MPSGTHRGLRGTCAVSATAGKTQGRSHEDSLCHVHLLVALVLSECQGLKGHAPSLCFPGSQPVLSPVHLTVSSLAFWHPHCSLSPQGSWRGCLKQYLSSHHPTLPPLWLLTAENKVQTPCWGLQHVLTWPLPVCLAAPFLLAHHQ